MVERHSCVRDAVRAGDPPRAHPTGVGRKGRAVRRDPRWGLAPAAAEPHGFRVAPCQSAGSPQGTSGGEVSLSGGRQTSGEAVPRPRPNSPHLIDDGWRSPRDSRPPRPAPGWSRGDSNPGPPPCKGGALPAKLRPPVCAVPAQRVGAPGLEPGTSALSGPRSNHLSYAPVARSGFPVVHSGGRPMPKTERAHPPGGETVNDLATRRCGAPNSPWSVRAWRPRIPRPR